MKLGRIFTVVSIVVVAHVIALFMLVRTSQQPEDAAMEPQAESGRVEEGAGAVPSVQPGETSPTGADVVPRSRDGRPSEASVKQSIAESYSTLDSMTFAPFINDPGDLPGKIESHVSRGCRAGILVDLDSRRILWQKDAHRAYAIASMSKIMTAYELLCELKTPGCKTTLETMVKVPRELYRKFGDCHIYMDPRESFSVDELLKCMMIHSANDCAYLLAMHMAGSEAAFVARMNERAQSLGYKSMSFCNSNGLPDRKRGLANRASALEMAMLSERVLAVPEIMKWASTRVDAIRESEPKRKFMLVNKNRLLGVSRCPGIDGLKTGYIDESKFCISVTCKRNGRRMVCVVMGCDSSRKRDKLVVELINWGYSVK